MLDRIDLCVNVPATPAAALALGPGDEARSDRLPSSAEIRLRVAAARGLQVARQRQPNARLSARDLERYCVPDADATALLARAATSLSLSARAYHRVVKVARTIADLAGSVGITSVHVAEAIGYRRHADA